MFSVVGFWRAGWFVSVVKELCIVTIVSVVYVHHLIVLNITGILCLPSYYFHICHWWIVRFHFWVSCHSDQFGQTLTVCIYIRSCWLCGIYVDEIAERGMESLLSACDKWVPAKLEVMKNLLHSEVSWSFRVFFSQGTENWYIYALWTHWREFASSRRSAHAHKLFRSFRARSESEGEEMESEKTTTRRSERIKRAICVENRRDEGTTTDDDEWGPNSLNRWASALCVYCSWCWRERAFSMRRVF